MMEDGKVGEISEVLRLLESRGLNEGKRLQYFCAAICQKTTYDVVFWKYLACFAGAVLCLSASSATSRG